MGDKITKIFSEAHKKIPHDRFTSLISNGKTPKLFKPQENSQMETFIEGHWGQDAPVNQLNEYPACATGRIEAHFDDNSSIWSSGCLVDGNIVLTCAHNCRKVNTKTTEIWFYPAYCPTSEERAKFKVIKEYIPVEYKKNQYQHDYAFLELDNNLADNYGYLGIDFSDEVSQSNLVLAGYPTDTNGALHMYQGKVKYYQNQLIHTMNTNQGLGGSPIIELRNNQFYVVGIHGYRKQQKDERVGIKLNMGMRKAINKELPIVEQHLQLSNKLVKSEVFAQFFKQDWRRVESVVLDANKFDEKMVKDLATLRWDKLKKLSLCNNSLDSRAIAKLAQIKLEFIEQLYLSNNSIRKQGVQQLAKNTWNNLRCLWIDGCELKDEGTVVFFDSNWPKLKQINLSNNTIGKLGFITIQKSSLVLHTLIMENNLIDAQGAAQLAKGKFLQLTSLSIKSNKLRDQGVIELLKNQWPALNILDLAQNLIENQGFKCLCKSKLPHLQELLVSYNRIGDGGIQQLLKTNLGKLKHLDFRMNLLGKDKEKEYAQLLTNYDKNVHFEI